MTGETIKIDVPGAQGTYGPAASDLAANRGAVGSDGVRPGFGTALSGLSTTSNANIDAAAALNGQGSQFANGFDSADKDGAAKAGAAGPKGPGDPSSPAGAPKGLGADKFSSRLTPSDLLKMASQPYQSAMPAVQSLPQMAQSIPSMLNAPLQAAQAPIQSMLSGPGGSSILNGLLSRGNAGNGFDGGPASLALGSRPSGAADARLYDVTKKYLGMPYAWGGGHGTSPGPTQGTHDGGGPADQAGDYNKIGVDCSGLSRAVLAEVWGIDIGGTSESQYASGMPVSSPVAGDLVFPKGSFGSGGPGHVQVYLGNGQVLEAPSSGQTVKISPLQGGSQFRRFVQAA